MSSLRFVVIAALALALAGCSIPVPDGHSSRSGETIADAPVDGPSVIDIHSEGGWEEQVCLRGDCSTLGGLEPIGIAIEGNTTGFIAELAWSATNPTVANLTLASFLDGKPLAEQSGPSPLRLILSKPVAHGRLAFSVHGANESVSYQQAFDFNLHVFRDHPVRADFAFK